MCFCYYAVITTHLFDLFAAYFYDEDDRVNVGSTSGFSGEHPL